MGGRACDQRARVRAAAGRGAAGVYATGRTRAAFRTRPGGGAFMDPGACRALVDSEPSTASIESNTRSTTGGASAGVDARR
jgi:hypothetical protein